MKYPQIWGSGSNLVDAFAPECHTCVRAPTEDELEDQMKEDGYRVDYDEEDDRCKVVLLKDGD